ncbi:glycosyltransferase family 52, partial [Acinetobacter baumannii]
MLKKNKNLIICLTPLQMLIADSILQMKKKEKEEYIFICVCYGYNDKYDLYFNKLRNKSNTSFLYQVTSVGKLGRFFDLLSYKRNVVKQLDKKFNNIYFASIDNPFVQLTLSKVKFNNMISFDDGTANLWVNSVYNIPINRGFIQKMISKLVGIVLNEESIKAKIFKHYTIFKNS